MKRIEIYADGADLKTMAALADKCAGATTNPSLLRKAGVTNYRAFAREVLAIWDCKPVSFEVLADDLPTMQAQALEIASWGENVLVKVPVMNAQAVSTGPVIAALTEQGVKVNVTAIMTAGQALSAINRIAGPGSIVSLFCGRIADTGRDPVEQVVQSLPAAREAGVRVLWASAREPFNVVQAEGVGCDIITLTPTLIEKLALFGKDLNQYSLETVREFYRDSQCLQL